MKKIFYVIMFFCFFGLAACQKKEFKDDTIYLFWQPGCSYCHNAIEFFKTSLPTVNVELVDISTKEGHQKILKAVKKYKLGPTIGTPFFVYSGKYQMGWSMKLAEEFKKIAPDFQK